MKERGASFRCCCRETRTTLQTSLVYTPPFASCSLHDLCGEKKKPLLSFLHFADAQKNISQTSCTEGIFNRDIIKAINPLHAILLFWSVVGISCRARVEGGLCLFVFMLVDVLVFTLVYTYKL